MANLFDAQTKDVIEGRMVQNLKTVTGSDKSTIEGTFSRDLIDANAVEFENSYAEMAMLRDAAFAETSWGEYLTFRASEFGIDRKEAVKAKGYITVKGSSSSYIIKNSLFQTQDGVGFYTEEDATIPSGKTSVTIPIIALDAGKSGNVDSGTITEIPYSIPGVYSVENENATTDGADEETDEALLSRLLFKVRQPITSGNANHYSYWAMSVDGVGNCKVLPLWNGNGTVKVIIVTSENAPASKDLIAEVAACIEEQRPIGATVTVVSPKLLTIDISASIYGKANTETVKKAITAYFKADGFNLSYVSIARIGKLLLEVDGITDYKNLRLNGVSDNVSLTNEELPVVGKVVLSYATK